MWIVASNAVQWGGGILLACMGLSLVTWTVGCVAHLLRAKEAVNGE